MNIYSCDYSKQANFKCLAANLKVKCSSPVHGLFCNRHLDLIFSLSVVINRFATRDVARQSIYLAPTKYTTDYIPFPYDIIEPTSPADADAEVCLYKDWAHDLNKWVSKIDLNHMERCQLLNILGVLFTEQVVSPDASQVYTDYQVFKSNYSACIKDRYTDCVMSYYTSNETETKNIAVEKLPFAIKVLLFHTEMAKNPINGTMYTISPNLIMSTKSRTFKMFNESQSEPLCIYDISKHTDVATKFVLTGTNKSESANLLYNRTLILLKYNPTNSIKMCT